MVEQEIRRPELRVEVGFVDDDEPVDSAPAGGVSQRH
jgi:hypothetical protein